MSGQVMFDTFENEEYLLWDGVRYDLTGGALNDSLRAIGYDLDRVSEQIRAVTATLTRQLEAVSSLVRRGERVDLFVDSSTLNALIVKRLELRRSLARTLELRNDPASFYLST
jgi:hypothetical protein